jgi:hypothetical protein
MEYIGQTGWSFRTRFHEYCRDFKYNNNNKSKFGIHLLENHHSIGCIDDILEIFYITGKARAMDTMEIFYIYKETKSGNQINDKNTVKQNFFLVQ